MKLCKLSECESYKLPQGRIFIAESNERISSGYLELKPNSKLEKHNRPIDEELRQIKGKSTIALFEGKPKEIVLNEGNCLKISANVFHIHKNESKESSLTLWKFEGNITGVIANSRDNFPRKRNKL